MTVTHKPEDEDSVRVVARFRPFNARELSFGNLTESEEMLEFTDTSVKITHEGHPELSFVLNHVFGKATKQHELFDVLGGDLVSHMLKGFNVTIFAYGQTGAGKSFSMLGDVDSEENQGLIPRVSADLFDKIQEIATIQESTEFTISCSYLEIYQEEVKDLLTRSSKKLTIRESPAQGVYVENLTSEYVGSPDDIYDLLSIGDRMKKVASTNMNMRSSRSHTCFMIKIFQKDENDCTKEAKLNLVDLAGSERIKKTGASGQTLEEAKKINLSLTCLSHCINALTDATKSHVPFRGSKLTRLLQESLGGNSKTTVLVACSPHIDNLEETICTLRFAERCKKVTNKAKENVQLSPAQLTKMCQRLTDEIANLKLYTMTLEGALRRLGVEPTALESGKLEIDASKPLTIKQTIDKGTVMTPRAETDGLEDLVTTYENQTVITPSKHVIKNQKLNELPPPGQTYVTSTVTLKEYSLDTFGEKEQQNFLKGVVQAMDNDEITLDKLKILEMTAGSVNVTFRVQAPTFLASSVSDVVQSEKLAAALTKNGVKSKGMAVTKKPFLTRGTVRPKDVEAAKQEREKAKVDGMPSLEFFSMSNMPLEKAPLTATGVDKSEVEQLANQIVDLKSENEALQSELLEQQKVTEDKQVDLEQAIVQIDALHERVRMLLSKLELNQPVTVEEINAIKLEGVEISLGQAPAGGERDVAVLPEPTIQEGGLVVNAARHIRTGSQRPTHVSRRSRRIDTSLMKSEDLDKAAPPKLSAPDEEPKSRRVPQLFVPMDEAEIEGEYRTFVATDYAEPAVPRRRDDDEFDALDKVKELQATVDRQADIVERQSVLLAHQDKLNKQQVEDMKQLQQDKAELEQRLSEYEIRLLDAMREAQPGATSVDYRGMGYGGRRPSNIRMPVRPNDSLLGANVPTMPTIASTRNSARTSRTLRTARGVDRRSRDTSVMAGVFAMISDILEFENNNNNNNGAPPDPNEALPKEDAKVKITVPDDSDGNPPTVDLRQRNRMQKASNVQRPKSPPRSNSQSFSVGRIFGL